MIKDPLIFAEVADALKIDEPAFVEKDYYLAQALKLFFELKLPDFTFVLSGGTCLSKAHQNTNRMSEDIDIVFYKQKSDNRPARKALSKDITEAISRSVVFKLLNEPQITNQYKGQVFDIGYPKKFPLTSSMRKELKLELTVSAVYPPIEYHPISSMCAQVMKQPGELARIPCANKESILVGKLIALLWRVSACASGKDVKADDRLIRHMYDIHILRNENKVQLDSHRLQEISIESLQYQSRRYKPKYPEFAKNPKKILSHGLQEIQTNAAYKEYYKRFLDPFVYSQNKPDWDEVMSSLNELYQQLYHKKMP